MTVFAIRNNTTKETIEVCSSRSLAEEIMTENRWSKHLFDIVEWDVLDELTEKVYAVAEEVLEND